MPHRSRSRAVDNLALALSATALALLIALPLQAQVSPSTPNQVPMAPDGTPPDASLSEKLNRSGGEIRPPSNMDPEIHVPAPEPNPQTTPVIPPPGTPGGDQSVQPK